MARIDQGVFRQWRDGERMTADEYAKDREILRTAINDFQGEVDVLKTTISAVALDALGTEVSEARGPEASLSNRLQNVDSELTNVNTELNNVNTQLADIEQVAVIADAYKIQIPEVDDTARLQRAIDSLNGNGALTLSYGKTYQVTGLIVAGDIEIQGNNATFSSVAADNTTPIIKGAEGQNVVLKVTGVKFSGKNRAIELNLAGSAPDVGRQLSLYKCRFDGISNVSDGIYLRQIDFVEIDKCKIINYNTAITIESNYTLGERDNTQIHLRNINLQNCKLGAKFRQVDKAVIDGLDINTCGCGIYLETDNKRMQFNSCHVEHYGKVGYDSSVGNGYAYYMSDNKFQPDNSFNNCTSLIPETNALGGFYLGEVESQLSNVQFENCYFAHDAALTNHKAVYLYGSYIWNGRFTYNNTSAKTWKSTLSRVNGVIDDTGYSLPKSKNLLPFSMIDDPADLTGSIGTGTLTVDADPDGIYENARLMTITATANTEKYVTKSLKTGWYTLLLSGYQKTGSPLITVQQLASPYTTAVSVKPSNQSNNMVRVPFYVAAEATYKIGITASANASFVLSQIEVVRGFGKDFTQ